MRGRTIGVCIGALVVILAARGLVPTFRTEEDRTLDQLFKEDKKAYAVITERFPINTELIVGSVPLQEALEYDERFTSACVHLMYHEGIGHEIANPSDKRLGGQAIFLSVRRDKDPRHLDFHKRFDSGEIHMFLRSNILDNLANAYDPPYTGTDVRNFVLADIGPEIANKLYGWNTHDLIRVHEKGFDILSLKPYDMEVMEGNVWAAKAYVDRGVPAEYANAVDERVLPARRRRGSEYTKGIIALHQRGFSVAATQFYGQLNEEHGAKLDVFDVLYFETQIKKGDMTRDSVSALVRDEMSRVRIRD